MEFISKRKADEECGPADAIKPKEINSMLELARVSKKDVFYDLGSGNGRIVRTVVRKTKAHRAYGIEKDARRFCEAVRIAKENLTRRQLNRIDFWRAAFTNYDFSDATIIYNGLTEDQDEIELYKKQFQGRRVKIIKTDLPLVSYKPVASSFCKDVRFYLMKYPLETHRISSKNIWASYVLKNKNSTIEDVYKYHSSLLKTRGFSKHDIEGYDIALKDLVAERFSK